MRFHGLWRVAAHHLRRAFSSRGGGAEISVSGQMTFRFPSFLSFTSVYLNETLDTATIDIGDGDGRPSENILSMESTLRGNLESVGE